MLLSPLAVFVILTTIIIHKSRYLDYIILTILYILSFRNYQNIFACYFEENVGKVSDFNLVNISLP